MDFTLFIQLAWLDGADGGGGVCQSLQIKKCLKPQNHLFKISKDCAKNTILTYTT